MPPDKIRVDYDGLKQIAQQFSQQAEAVSGTIRKLEQAANALRQGDWIGEGAKKFYEEYDSAVLPSLKRLGRALENGSQTTKKIDEAILQAEELAARLLGGAAAAVAAAAAFAQTSGTPEADGGQRQQSPAEATEASLNNSGITLRSSGNCRDRNNRRCTSVEGIRQQTVDGLIAFRNAVGVDLVVTGGTEVGHDAGRYSHYNGYKADVSLDPAVNRYIESNFQEIDRRAGDRARQFRDAAGNIYAREGHHWDITYY